MMFTIGLTLEKETFRIAILKKEKKSIAIESLQTFSHSPDSVKLFYNLPPFHTGKDIQIVSGLTGSDVFIRKLHLPLRDRRKILAALPFQLESLIPFSSESPIICPLLKPLSKQMTAVTVVATTQAHLSSHITTLKEIDVEPDTISCSPIALARFARWKFPQEFRILCFEAREKKLSCVLLEDNELLLSQSISVNDRGDAALELEKLSIFLKQKGVVDDQTAWILTGDSESFSEIISKIFTGQKLVLCQQNFCGFGDVKAPGSNDRKASCIEFIQRALRSFNRRNFQVRPNRKNFCDKALDISDSHLAHYAVPIGLALDALAADGSSVQFCQKEFTPEHTWQSRKKKMLHYLGLCLGATLLMSIGGSFVLAKKQHHLVEKLQSYLSSSSSKNSLTSIRQIEEKLQEWDHSLRGQKSSFAFVPTVPKVSDLLAWLSVHPSFATEEGGQKEGVDIKSLHYSLVKYPKIGDAASPYAAQVELEFTSLTPRSARDFHEALLKGDQIVNVKREVKWQTQNQLYYTSFELNKGIGS
jgi:type IV pilus assembly protein PilM